MKGIRNGSVMWRNTCQGLQPSTLAASIGSFGLAIKPARSRMANTEVDIHTSAEMIERLASVLSTSHGIGSLIRCSVNTALLTKPIESLRWYLNRKLTRIGEYIIGNIM